MNSSNTRDTFAKHSQMRRHSFYETEPYARSGAHGFSEIQDEIRLKKALRRAVANIEAPQYLIETIRNAIRK